MHNIQHHLLIIIFSLASTVSMAKTPYNVFEEPVKHIKVQQAYAALGHALKQRNYGDAEAVARKLLEIVPDHAVTHYNLACIQALQGKPEDAVKQLGVAVEHGFRNVKKITSDPDLVTLRDHKDYKSIVEKAKIPYASNRPAIAAVKPANGVAKINADNTRWNAKTALMEVALLPPLPLEKNQAPTTSLGKIKGLEKETEMVNGWIAEGKAAGNHGDFYLNSDGDHSKLNIKPFPGMTTIEHGDDAMGPKGAFAKGLQRWFLFNQPVLGNTSMASTVGPFWRSLPRAAMSNPQFVRTQAIQYLSNQLYFYPEHRDYDENHGDVYPANTPYVIISQGSSGSDKPFMRAAALTLAAFQPETKRKLTQSRLLALTLQSLLRQSYARTSNSPVTHHRSGLANPVVFDRNKLDVSHMIKAAQAMAPDNLPPVAKLTATKLHDPPANTPPAITFHKEALFSSPHAVAGVFRRLSHDFVIDLSAMGSKDPEGGALTYHWVVWRGPKGTDIRYNSPDHSSVTVTIPWFEPFPVEPGSKKLTHRVDIALYVNDGTQDSSPAIFSLYRPPHEMRDYNDDNRLRSIDYRGTAYRDPQLFPKKDWKDEYRYKSDGTLLGWHRTSNGTKTSFTPNGMAIVLPDLNPVRINYNVKTLKDNTREIVPVISDAAATPAQTDAP